VVEHKDWSLNVYQFVNWLRVLSTAELSQVDQGICHQLHPIVPLLDTLVVYALFADNVPRLLPIRLRGVNQPAIRSRNPFSRPHLARLACI
jgi:hypothetical protein